MTIGIPIIEDQEVEISCYYNGTLTSQELMRPEIDFSLILYHRSIAEFDTMTSSFLLNHVEYVFPLKTQARHYPLNHFKLGRLDSMKVALVLYGDTICKSDIGTQSDDDSGFIDMSEFFACPHLPRVKGQFEEAYIVFYDIYARLVGSKNRLPNQFELEDAVIWVKPQDTIYYDQKPARLEMPE